MSKLNLTITSVFLFFVNNLVAAPVIIPAPPPVGASGYLLIDASSGAVIVEKNADEKLPPASLTKLMTSYVLSYELEKGNVSNSDMVTISKNAWAQNPVFAGSSLMWVEVGKKVPLEALHKGVVISSGNDASVAVAEHLAGSEGAFADVMNQHAQILGMKDSHFVNAHGLPDPNHYMTARDLGTLARAILKYPEEYALYSQPEFTYNNITQTNRNRLLWKDDSVDGLKTGHTIEAGYCLVSSAQKGGMRLISVVMGAKSESSREQETQKLLAYGFRYFETHTLYAQGDEITESKLWSGMADSFKLGVDQDIYLTVAKGKQGDINAVMNIDNVIKAPIIVGKEYGELVVSLDGKELLREPLVALESVEKAGFFKALWHTILLFLTQLITA